MPDPEICDPRELPKLVITYMPLYTFLNFISSSGGTVNGVGGELSIVISHGLGRSIEAPERRDLFADKCEGEFETTDVAVLEGPEAIGKYLKSKLRSNITDLAQPRRKSV